MRAVIIARDNIVHKNIKSIFQLFSLPRLLFQTVENLVENSLKK